MSNASSLPKTAVEAVPQLVQILTGLADDERQKAISATMILLGSPAFPSSAPSHGEKPPTNALTATDGVSSKAASWLSKVGLTLTQLEHVFSIESDSIEIIAAKLSGTSKRHQTIDAYLLAGLRIYLRTGETEFSDEDARAVCRKVGCYDNTNHSSYVKALGNSVHGSKSTGWKITNPGLAEAAKVVKSLAPASND